MLIRDRDQHVPLHSDNISTRSNGLYLFSFIHLNVNSLLHKLDIIYAEFCEFDILASSETWLNSSVNADDLYLYSFRKPERKDRIGDSDDGDLIHQRYSAL